MYYDETLQRYMLDVPAECPKDGGELELDIDYEKTVLRCKNESCDYEIDVTEEFEKVSAANGDE